MALYHPIDADIIVIGAGLSGLAAAFTLIEKEPTLTIIILEASKQIGGRTLTQSLHTKGGKISEFDMGTYWISSQQPSMIDLIEKLNLQLNKNKDYGDIITVYKGRNFRSKQKASLPFLNTKQNIELATFIGKIEKLCKNSIDDPNLAHISMNEFIETNLSSTTIQVLIKTMIVEYCGIEASECTLAFYLFFCTSTYGIVNQLINHRGFREFRLQNGASEVCKKLAIYLDKDVMLLTNEHVLQIENNRNYVRVKTHFTSYYATNIITAISPYEMSKIQITPELASSKKQILQKLRIKQTLTTFVATYNDTFWKRQGLSGEIYILDSPPILHCFDITSGTIPALFGFILSGGAPKSVILQQISVYLGDEALQPLDFALQNWNGGICYSNAGDLFILKENDGRIFWAGAETSTEWFGCLEGALRAGQRAALEVLYDMRPASLTVDDMHYFTLNMSPILRNHHSYNNIYKKVANPYYQVGIAGIVLVSLYIFWRNFAKKRLLF